MRSNGVWWLVSVLGLVGSFVTGLLICLSLPRQESDWFGARYIVALGGSVLVGSIIAMVAGFASLVRNEQRTGWASITGGIGIIYVIVVVGALVRDRSKMQIYETNWNAQVIEQNRLKEELRRNPNIALEERWQDKRDLRFEVWRYSFSDASIPYTVELLERIYADAPQMRDHLFANTACSAEFISRYFSEAYDYDPRRDSYERLANMVSNPNAPDWIIESVAKALHLPVGATEPAKRALEIRKKK